MLKRRKAAALSTSKVASRLLFICRLMIIIGR